MVTSEVHHSEKCILFSLHIWSGEFWGLLTSGVIDKLEEEEDKSYSSSSMQQFRCDCAENLKLTASVEFRPFCSHLPQRQELRNADLNLNLPYSPDSGPSN